MGRDGLTDLDLPDHIAGPKPDPPHGGLKPAHRARAALGCGSRRLVCPIRHQLVATGQSIGELDMMIAAHSLSAAAVLVTNNTGHYARIDVP